jgi:Domain of unknown function (DUF4136)
MSMKLRYWVSMLILPILAGCYPKGAEYAEELDLVYTNFYDQFDFASKRTFAMSDSVIKITGAVFEDPDGNKKPEFVSATYATAITSAIKANMTSSGWNQVPKNANPDVILLVSAMTTTNIYYYYDWWYWGWYYPGWCACYGWYYPGWYYPPYVSGYRSGSVFIQMVDPKSIGSGNDNVAVVWNSIFNGLAEGSTANITSRIQAGIGKAFAQSPYLKH